MYQINMLYTLNLHDVIYGVYFKLSPTLLTYYSYLKTKQKRKQVLAGMWWIWNSCYSHYIARNGKRCNCCEKQLCGSSKIKYRIAMWPSSSTHGYIPRRNDSRDSNTYLHADVDSSKIHSSQRGKQPKCPSTDERVNKMWVSLSIWGK